MKSRLLGVVTAMLIGMPMAASASFTATYSGLCADALGYEDYCEHFLGVSDGGPVSGELTITGLPSDYGSLGPYIQTGNIVDFTMQLGSFSFSSANSDTALVIGDNGSSLYVGTGGELRQYGPGSTNVRLVLTSSATGWIFTHYFNDQDWTVYSSEGVLRSVGVGGFQANSVPAPATLALVGIGLAALGLARRRKEQ